MAISIELRISKAASPAEVNYWDSGTRKTLNALKNVPSGNSNIIDINNNMPVMQTEATNLPMPPNVNPFFGL